jgi:hypothetical protein
MSSTNQNHPKDSKTPATRATRHLAEPSSPEPAARKGRIARLFEVNAKPADGSVLPITPRRPQRTWRFWGLALLAVACGMFWIARAQQQPDTPEQTSEPMPADDASQTTAPMETEDVTQSNQPAPAEELAGTNSAAQTDGSSSANASSRRSRRSYRRRSGTGYSSATYGSSAGGQTANGRADFTNFNVIVKNNIFDPLRRKGLERSGPPPVAHEVQSFALKGTASMGNDNLAVFDGTRSEFHKAARVSDTIAAYKVTEITPDLVKLAAGTNLVELRVGMQMRREDEGPWTRSESSRSYASAATASSSASAAGSTSIDPPSSGPESEILKKLMKQREQE